ncbi:hypothetical protein BGX34_007450 [Mortierella sp. NVP85]|nr:hypothetical protein BGX34_007450 [Mortierella sp. NVP85]
MDNSRPSSRNSNPTARDADGSNRHHDNLLDDSSHRSTEISSEDTDVLSSTGATNGYHRYSIDESGHESAASDTTALESNKHVRRTNSFNKHQKLSGAYQPNDQPTFDSEGILKNKRSTSEDDESDVDLDFGFDPRDHQDPSSKIPLVSFKSGKSQGRSKTRSSQPKRKGEYGRISNDSFNSGYSRGSAGGDDDDDDELDFGQEEEAVGMMSGSRTNRSGIGGHDETVEAKLPDHGGSLLSSFLNMANSIIGADWTVGLLVHSGKLSGRTTYQDLLMFCFGKAGLIMISLFQFIFAFGALIPGIEDMPVVGFLARRTFVITFCTVLISFPLSLYRDISKLAKTSAIAMLALVVIIIAVMIEGPRAPKELRGDPKIVWSFVRPDLFQSIGVISFGNILNNFPSDNFIINIARFCFGVNMFTTLPLEAFVIETYFFPGESFSMKRHMIITTGLVGTSLIIALLTCNLGFVLEVTGGFSATALAFILPPMCYLKLASGSILSMKKLPHLACLLFGVAVMILSTFFSLQHFLEPRDPNDSTCSV